MVLADPELAAALTTPSGQDFGPVPRRTAALAFDANTRGPSQRKNPRQSTEDGGAQWPQYAERTACAQTHAMLGRWL